MRVLDHVDRGGGTCQRDQVDQPGHPAPPRIGVDGRQLGPTPNSEQILQEQQVLRIRARSALLDSSSRRRIIKIGDPERGAQQRSRGVERDLARMGLAVDGEDVNTATASCGTDFAGDAALADTRRTGDPDDTAGARDRLIQNAPQRPHLPGPTHQQRIMTLLVPALRGHPQRPPHRHRLIGALDPGQLGLAQYRDMVHQPGSRFAEHHAAGRRNRLHPLRETDLLADSRVVLRGRAEFSGNHLTGIQSHPQRQVYTVGVGQLRGQLLGLLLNLQRRQASPHRVVLQRQRHTEHRHDRVADELLHPAAIPPHHGVTPVEQLGHDLAQPLRAHLSGKVHRMDHVGEQHRDLLVFGGRGRRDRCAAFGTELGAALQFGGARDARGHGITAPGT